LGERIRAELVLVLVILIVLLAWPRRWLLGRVAEPDRRTRTIMRKRTMGGSARYRAKSMPPERLFFPRITQMDADCKSLSMVSALSAERSDGLSLKS